MAEKTQILDAVSKRSDSSQDDRVERDTEAWMDTLSDLIFLMITFFVLLITMSSMDQKKLKEAFGIFNDASGVMAFPDASQGKESIIQMLMPISDINLEAMPAEGVHTSVEDVQDDAARLLKTVADGMMMKDRERSLYDTLRPLAEKVQGDVQVIKIDGGVEVRISGRILFMPGKTELNERGRTLIEEVARIFKLWGGDVRIVSHWPWQEGPVIMTEIIRVLVGNRVSGEKMTPELFPDMRRHVRFVLKKGENDGQ